MAYRRRSTSRRRKSRRRTTSRRRKSRRRTTSRRRSTSKGRRRRRRSKSRRKSRRKAGPHLKAWVKAARAEGFMKKGGDFKPLPKKGSASYKRIRARYEALLR